MTEIEPEPREVTIDLRRQIVSVSRQYGFDVAPLDKRLLLEGVDETELVLRHIEDVAAFQESDRQRRPWVYRHWPRTQKGCGATV
jgi:3-isopropylmalate/(R)-2-methylmalate dehydratase small subunit